MRKVLAFGLTISLAGVTLYACSDATVESGPIPEVDGSTPDAKSSTLGDVYVPDAKVTGEDDSSTGTDSGPKDSGRDASDAGTDASDSGVVLPVGATNFTSVRVGAPGGGALSTASFPVFVEERKLSDGSVVSTVNLPIAAAATQAAFTLRGTGTTEGKIQLSTDNAYLMLAGYSAIPGVDLIAMSAAATVPRVVARIDKAGAVDTSTVLAATAFDTGAPRSVASTDGANFWVTGEGGSVGGGPTGGIHYVAFGTNAGNDAQVFSSLPTNLRFGAIFGGQLYASTQSGATRLFSVGTGMPTDPAQALTAVPGLPADSKNAPDGFVFLDLDAGVAGVDTLYIADQSSLVNGGGIQKWKLAAAGGNWAKVATFTNNLTGGPGFLTAKAYGTSVVIVTTTGENPARIVRYVDDGVNLTPTGVLLATGVKDTVVYRGVAFRPE